jgi:O-antigen ligase
MRTAALWLSFVLVFTIPWEDAINVAGLGTLTRVIGMLVGAVWLISVVLEGKFRKPHPSHMFMFLFVLWNIVSLFWSIGVKETEQQIETYIQLAFLAWILWDLYLTPKAQRMALEAYILGAYVTIGSTIFNYFTGQTIDAYEQRYAGANVNANDLAITIALALPVAWYLIVSATEQKKSNLLALINYAYVPAALFSIILTSSRTALFAVIPAIVYIVWSTNFLKPFHRTLIYATLVVILLTALPFMPQPNLQRFATTWTSISTGDLGGRGELWDTSIAVFLDHPLLGVGSGSLKTALLGAVAHNTFLSVLAELGLIGFTFFVLMLAIVGVHAAGQPKRSSMLWLTVLAIWAVGAFALTWEYRKPTWFFLSQIVISASLFRSGYRVGEEPLLSNRPVGQSSTGLPVGE